MMEAAGQSPYSANIYIDWATARQPSGAYIKPETLIQYRVHKQAE
jgi:hypothetical protein